MKDKNKRALIVLTALLCPLTILPANAQEIVAVLSSQSPYYLEAFNSFQDAIGRPVESFDIEKAPFVISAATKVVVTFGGKAAAREYQTGTRIVSCMAPAVELSRSNYADRYFIPMSPHPGRLLSKLQVVQPELKSLVIFWISESMREYLRQMRKDAASLGITLTEVRLKNADELPERLRGMPGTIDAIFFPPDPLLVNVQTFGTVRDFSEQNHVPFYAPTEALVGKGATASVSSSFESMGRGAARMTSRLLNGETVGRTAYPEEIRLAVNLKAADRAGLKITPEMQAKADKVFP
ncbi:MAG: hypothetical protein A2218_07125 [Elusimicrobia bacterium RIFOXYA2_FULL_53_38]|nr:MAG: hypothetical protein A2218_07125 [Elusimicrobia bacterium RIFOXYA2_FULL_53_38]